MSSFIHKLNTALRLSSKDWLLFMKSWLMMFYIRIRMDYTPFKSWKKWLINQPVDQQSVLTEQDIQTVAKTRRIVVLASRYHIINANCLPKSLALKWLLDRENIGSELKMGLSLEKPDFKGHAWLMRGNLVLNDNTNVAEQYPIEQKIDQRPLIN